MKLLRAMALHTFYVAATLTLMMTISIAGEADVIDVTVEPLGDGQYRISATVLHEDAGWDHYANRWDVLDESGHVIGSRELAHPHENEQPFTRSLNISIPATIKKITVRANDSVHATGGKIFVIDVPHS